jgi:hypothetical protein
MLSEFSGVAAALPLPGDNGHVALVWIKNEMFRTLRTF